MVHHSQPSPSPQSSYIRPPSFSSQWNDLARCLLAQNETGHHLLTSRVIACQTRSGGAAMAMSTSTCTFAQFVSTLVSEDTSLLLVLCRVRDVQRFDDVDRRLRFVERIEVQPFAIVEKQIAA